MKIENKGALVEAFAVKFAEIQRLNYELGKAKSDLEVINQAIVVDKDLLGIIQEGGIHTVNDALVYWNDHNEQLEIAKVIHSWSEKTELNAEQLQLIGGLNE
ncbi:hypothetical protein PODOV050v2_p0025 [Vibrio phage 66E30.1]|nr:hypothetical protein PODOV001v2_p0023 [Vibrio phage 41E34.2]QZI91254.1 hypothetical protein PODOV053v2_p0026 [Vibrio phage 24E30.2]QZI91293.1 hypothetical protein PODOV052v2_p0025 [Vibrio phage 24E35.2]QZI91454.1 hypothetical protein PODOV048v2_p0023 [Vibrio phage 34E29.1]QZI91491.1 hypothetical protein PODOV007v2_p0023 [Vibrio phage 36E38.1]QZI91760.1 hypothetical protein PODOV008v2_p0023 [Vibrio phage 44E38.1]QZI91797.1 hypothetical protein PODOV046v2_p0023 [Vibrio phage 44E38.2]QZI9198